MRIVPASIANDTSKRYAPISPVIRRQNSQNYLVTGYFYSTGQGSWMYSAISLVDGTDITGTQVGPSPDLMSGNIYIEKPV